MNNLYCCYSIPLRDYLTSKGLRWEIVALSPNTKSTMWVYLKTEELKFHLDIWSQGKK